MLNMMKTFSVKRLFPLIRITRCKIHTYHVYKDSIDIDAYSTARLIRTQNTRKIHAN